MENEINKRLLDLERTIQKLIPFHYLSTMIIIALGAVLLAGMLFLYDEINVVKQSVNDLHLETNGLPGKISLEMQENSPIR